MGNKQSEAIWEKMEVLRAEIDVINNKEDADDEELTRCEALLEEWTGEKAKYDKAVDRENKVAEVLRAADQWAAEPATVDDVLDAQDWARDRARSAVEKESAGSRSKDWAAK